MKKFFKVKTVEQVLELIDQFRPLSIETEDLFGARGRILAETAVSEEDLPEFDRSTMDGYAVRSADTFGAGEGLPGLFEVVGEIRMGESPKLSLGPGQTARIWTGGMLPQGADAVIMIEYSRQVDERSVELARPAAPFDNVIRKGEDVRQGGALIPEGRRLRPQDLGLLAALGREKVQVFQKPRVGIISTGDEIVPVSQTPGPGQVRNVNTHTLSAQVESEGALAFDYGLVRDDPAALRAAVVEALAGSDLVLISGGSSVGIRDFTVEIIESLPGAEILVHGVSVSPGKPTIMARVDGKSIWGLPGHTVSAMITCDVFILPLIRKLSGHTESLGFGRTVQARLARNVPSVHGRRDYVRVGLEQTSDGLTARPILGKSGLISTMVKADGLVTIGLNDEGLGKGDEVEVLLFN